MRGVVTAERALLTEAHLEGILRMMEEGHPKWRTIPLMLFRYEQKKPRKTI